MHRTRRQVRRWPMVMIRRPLPHGARKRASYVEGCAAACGDSASSLGNGTAFSALRLRSGQGDAHQSKIFGSGIPIFPPAPNTWTLNILPLGQFRLAPRLCVSPIHIA
jgi:hypothetical protein